MDKEFNPVLSHICQLIINYSLVGQEDTTLEHSFRFRLSDMQSMFILTSQIEVDKYMNTVFTRIVAGPPKRVLKLF